MPDPGGGRRWPSLTSPAYAVRKLHRVVAPGGRVLASTHGVQVYHREPGRLAVTRASGTAACVGMLITYTIHLLAKRADVTPVAAPVVAAVNAAAPAVDRCSQRLREPVPGTIFANYHVVAEA